MKNEVFVKEFVTKLSDDNLKFLESRLSQRLFGDVADALNLLSNSPDMDRYLNGAKTAFELYDMTDSIQKFVEKEFDKRFDAAA